MTEDIIQAQAVIFLFAGYETTSTLLSFACAVFCEYPEVQDKLRKEIMDVAKHSRDCTYDMLADMPYMEKVILGKNFTETLHQYIICSNSVKTIFSRNVESISSSNASR